MHSTSTIWPTVDIFPITATSTCEKKRSTNKNQTDVYTLSKRRTFVCFKNPTNRLLQLKLVKLKYFWCWSKLKRQIWLETSSWCLSPNLRGRDQIWLTPVIKLVFIPRGRINKVVFTYLCFQNDFFLMKLWYILGPQDAAMVRVRHFLESKSLRER